MPLRRKSDIAHLAHLDRGAGAFHKMRASLLHRPRHGRLGVTRESSVRQLVTSPVQHSMVGEVTSGSDQKWVTWHSSYSPVFSTPRTRLMGTSTYELKQFRLIRRTQECLCPILVVVLRVHEEESQLHSSDNGLPTPGLDRPTALINVDQLVPAATRKIHGSVALTGVVLVETVHPSSLHIVRMACRLPTFPEQ